RADVQGRAEVAVEVEGLPGVAVSVAALALAVERVGEGVVEVPLLRRILGHLDGALEVLHALLDAALADAAAAEHFERGRRRVHLDDQREELLDERVAVELGAGLRDDGVEADGPDEEALDRVVAA